MTRTLENTTSTSLLDRVLNLWPWCLDSDSIRSIGIAWGFQEQDSEGVLRWNFVPRITPDTSLFYNAILFVRLSVPFGIFFHLRWAENWRRSFLQASLGWKLNGRITFGVLWLALPILYYLYSWHWWYLVLFFAVRFQSDSSAAAGVTGPNLGQAGGFIYGPH